MLRPFQIRSLKYKTSSKKIFGGGEREVGAQFYAVGVQTSKLTRIKNSCLLVAA